MKDIFPIRNTNCIAKFLGINNTRKDNIEKLEEIDSRTKELMDKIADIRHMKCTSFNLNFGRELEPIDKLKCDYCGRRNNIENELCLSCGAPLEDKINAPQRIWAYNGEEIKL